MNNIANSENGIKDWRPKREAHVVFYGPGLNLLEEPMDPELQSKVDQLRGKGVRFDPVRYKPPGSQGRSLSRSGSDSTARSLNVAGAHASGDSGA
ncbi:hypothetical protein [Thiomonas sp. FB-Cd]|uniref:hypothetical protein n=1 Tax=Thiomonas sp. FB-Cd TaxID=1158292 RepID=UPI0004DF8C3B|nr:hypothetical protein [Thiomonas sp. FB-Cd]